MRAIRKSLRNAAAAVRPVPKVENPLHRVKRTGLALGALSALAFGALGTLAPHPAAAQGFEADPVKNALDMLGLSDEPPPEIDYRERAPLVVPPSAAQALPTPQESAFKSNPNWPKDPDVARRKREEDDRNKPVVRDDPGRPLMPSELNKGRKRSAGLFGLGGGSNDSGSTSPNLLPSELGFKGWFNPNPSTDKITFNGEPERENLTQPPPGYQTPAPNAPYGVVEPKKDAPFKIPNLFDRQGGSD